MSTWVFLRGLTRESRHWGEFPDLFRRYVQDAEIVTLDLPGNGMANDIASPSTVAAMAEYCRAELTRRGLVPPYRVLAMSLGAMVTVAWAQAQSREVEACVLINTSMRPFNPFTQRLRPQAMSTLLGLIVRSQSAIARETAILRLTTRHPPSPEHLVSQWAGYRQSHRVSVSNALRQLLAAAHFRAAPKKPDACILILNSAGDGLVDPRCGQRIAQVWQCTIAVHPTAGHDIPVDDGEWVAREIRDWLAGECQLS